MPQLDASLIGGYKPIDIPDPVNQLAKYLQLSGLQQQNQSGALQLQQAQQSAVETNALRQYLSDPANQGQDPNAMRAGIQRIAPIAGQPILKGMLDTQKTQGEIQGTQLGNADKSRTAVGSLAGSLATTKPDLSPTDIARFAQEAAKMGVTVDPQDFAKAMKPDGTFDANAAREVLLGYQSKGMTPDQQMTAGRPGVIESPTGPVAYNKSNPTAGFTIMQPSGMPAAPQAVPQSAPQATPQQGLQATPVGFPRVTPAMQVSRDSDRLAILQDELTKTTNPGDRAAIQSEIARTAATQAAGTPFAGQQVSQAPTQLAAAPAALSPFMKFEKVNDPLTGRVSMVSTTPGPDGKFVVRPIAADGGDGTFKPTAADQALIDQIGKYQIAPPNANAIRNPHEAAILSEVAKQYPQFDATEFPARQKALRDFSTGPQGNALRSVSVASDHLTQLADVAEALKNGNYPLVNKLSNLYTTNTGGTAPNTFDAMKQIVGDEVVKAILGGSAGGVHDRAELAARLSAASSPAQLSEVIRSYRDLMGAQKDGLVSQYENTTGRTDAATRFNFGKKPATPSPVDQNTIDALVQKYGGK